MDYVCVVQWISGLIVPLGGWDKTGKKEKSEGWRRKGMAEMTRQTHFT